MDIPKGRLEITAGRCTVQSKKSRKEKQEKVGRSQKTEVGGLKSEDRESSLLHFFILTSDY